MRGHFRYLRFKTFPMTLRTPQCNVFWALLLSSEHSGVPEDSKFPTFPSVGLHPHTWPKWGCDIIIFGRNPWSLLARVLARILYRLPSNVIGCQFPILAWSPDLGIRVMSPLFIHSEVSPLPSIAENAWRSVGEISSTNSWKNSVGMPSHPGALPFGIARMASRISFNVSSLVSS